MPNPAAHLSYDFWTERHLQEELTRRGLSRSGHCAQMVQKLVQHDQTNHQYCPPTETFTADNDPDGSIESSRVDADTKFDFKCNNIIKTAWIRYHELMAKTEKTKRIVLGDAIYEKAKTRNAAISVIGKPKQGDDETEKHLEGNAIENSSKTKSEKDTTKSDAKTTKRKHISDDGGDDEHDDNGVFGNHRAKKLMSDTNKDFQIDYIESNPIAPQLSTENYVHLHCREPHKIRGDHLIFLREQYRMFAIGSFRVDWSGFFMIMKQTEKGDEDLQKLGDCLNHEMEMECLFDENVVSIEVCRKA
ncbi:hypothetical protein BKA61DRAFT_676801 [Leptodontidium sp. MPI-SDFR-AT-0119]|nr:hypothetical protein BKA61DRAFT_676801 [Leptodontidium sp. MPI-SDFR-AT-0119]